MKPEAAREALDAIMKSGIDFVACLPDSAFKELYEPLSVEPKVTYIQVANEGDGVGICKFVQNTSDVHDAIIGAVKSMNSLQAPVCVVLAGETLFKAD